MIGLAVALALVFLLCAVLHATLRQDIAMLLRVGARRAALSRCACASRRSRWSRSRSASRTG